MSTDDHTVSDLRARIAALQSQLEAERRFCSEFYKAQEVRIADLEREREHLRAATANDERD